MKLIVFNLILLAIICCSCDNAVPNVSKQLGELAATKAEIENSLVLLADNCQHNEKLFNEVILLYGKVKAQQHKIIEQLRLDIRKSSYFFSNQQLIQQKYVFLEKELKRHHQNYQMLAVGAIKNACQYKAIPSLDIDAFWSSSTVGSSIVKEVKGSAFKEQIIEDLEELKLPHYKEIINRRNPGHSEVGLP